MVEAPCMAVHDWGGCICRECGQIRGTNHEWDGCLCRRCHQARDEQHDWDGDVCRRCGKLRCPICGSTTILFDDQLYEQLCSNCGSTSIWGEGQSSELVEVQDQASSS